MGNVVDHEILFQLDFFQLFFDDHAEKIRYIIIVFSNFHTDENRSAAAESFYLIKIFDSILNRISVENVGENSFDLPSIAMKQKFLIESYRPATRIALISIETYLRDKLPPRLTYRDKFWSTASQ